MLALALLILRVVIGLTVAAHGAQKLFGWWDGPGMKGWTGAMNHMRIRPATPWAWMSAFAEFFGGIGLAVGFLTPLPASPSPARCWWRSPLCTGRTASSPRKVGSSSTF